MNQRLKNFNFILIVFILIIGIFKLGLISSFNNTGWEPDSYMHFLQLDTVYEDFPNKAFDNGLTVWARPIFKFTYGIPIEILDNSNLATVQIINLIVFSITAFILAKIIEKIFDSKFLSLISLVLITLGFLSFKSSISDLTEPLFTLLLVLGFWFLVKKENIYLAALFIGLSPLARFEGIFFIGIFGLWVLYFYRNNLKRNLAKIFKLGVISVLPVFIWNLIGYLHTGVLLYLFDRGYPTNSVEAYGSGSWLYYPVKFLTHEPITTLLFLFGVRILIHHLMRDNFAKIKKQDKNLDYKFLALMFATLFILSQVITWKFGMFGSAGLMRYFVGIMPFMIVIGIQTIETIAHYVLRIADLRLNKFVIRNPQSVVNLKYCFVVLLIIFQIFVLYIHFSGLFGFEKKWIRLEFPEHRESGIWIKENVPDDELVASDRPEVVYYANRDLTNSESWGMDFYRSDRKGIFVWSNSWTKGFGVKKHDPATIGMVGLEAFGDEIVLWRR